MVDDLDVLMSWTRAGTRGQEHQDRILQLARAIDDVGIGEKTNLPLDGIKYPPSDYGQVTHEAPAYYGLLAPQGVGVPHVVRAATGPAWNVFQNPVCWVKEAAARSVGSTERWFVNINLGAWDAAAANGIRGMGAVAARFSRKTYEPPQPDEDGNLPPPKPPVPRDGWPDLSDPILQNPDDISEGTYETSLSTTARVFIETPAGLCAETADPTGGFELRVGGRIGSGRASGNLTQSPIARWDVTRSAVRYARSAQGLSPADHTGVPKISMSIGKGSVTEDDLKKNRTGWAPYATNPSGNLYRIRHDGLRYEYVRPLPKILRADIRLSFDVRFEVDKDGRVGVVSIRNIRSHLFAT